MRDAGDGIDVVSVGAGGAVGFDLQLAIDNFARQALDLFAGARASAGQAKVKRVDAERFHEVQDFDFRFERRVGDGRRLQAVAQGLIVEQDGLRRDEGRGVLAVPVEDEVRWVHGKRSF